MRYFQSIKKVSVKFCAFKIFLKGLNFDEKASNREVFHFSTSTPKPWVAGSNPPAPAIIIGQKRSDRENKRKREISRDFSRFFAPNFF